MSKKKTPDNPTGERQVNFRAPSELYALLKYVADGLGLDISNLVRMVIKENIGPYKRRVDVLLAEKEGEE